MFFVLFLFSACLEEWTAPTQERVSVETRQSLFPKRNLPTSVGVDSDVFRPGLPDFDPRSHDFRSLRSFLLPPKPSFRVLTLEFPPPPGEAFVKKGWSP